MIRGREPYIVVAARLFLPGDVKWGFAAPVALLHALVDFNQVRNRE
jgi:hypothetical protein